MRLSFTAAILFGVFVMESAAAQGPARARVTGTVAESESGAPIPGAILELEGVGVSRWTLADSLGRFGLLSVPPGPQVLRVRRVGFVESRVPFVAPTSGTVTLHVRLARVALKLEQVTVTADPTGRARGELGTASVVDREAIANQTAASLQGILELTPGVPLCPPGLDGVRCPAGAVDQQLGGRPASHHSARDRQHAGRSLDSVTSRNSANDFIGAQPSPGSVP